MDLSFVSRYVSILVVCLTTGLCAPVGTAWAQSPEADRTMLRVQVSHPPMPGADVRVGLYTSLDNWLDDEPIFGGLAATTDTETTVVFDSLPPGTYGAAVYLDENRNGKLDRNLIGFFKESFGFSEKARARFGPPKWEDAVFEVSGSVVDILVRLD